METNKKVAGMILDEARYDILNGMHNIIYKYHRDDFARAMLDLGRKEAFMDFCRELSDKGHAMGWCKDPSCEHPVAK